MPMPVPFGSFAPPPMMGGGSSSPMMDMVARMRAAFPQARGGGAPAAPAAGAQPDPLTATQNAAPPAAPQFGGGDIAQGVGLPQPQAAPGAPGQPPGMGGGGPGLLSRLWGSLAPKGAPFGMDPNSGQPITADVAQAGAIPGQQSPFAPRPTDIHSLNGW